MMHRLLRSLARTRMGAMLRVYARSVPYLSHVGIFHRCGKTILEARGDLDRAEPVRMEWPADIRKPFVGLVDEYGQGEQGPATAYWPKYERFLINNDIPYEFYDVHRSDYLEKAARFDVIVWRTLSDPCSQIEAETRIWMLEKMLGKLCSPSYAELWLYEHKERQYYVLKMNGLPTPETFISHSYSEAADFIKTCQYPIVAKIATGSASEGVELVKSYRSAKRFINKVFNRGRATYWGYIKQKNYVIFQEFIPDAKHDLRVIIIGNKLFGYYRMVPKNDFRASGGYLIRRGAIPADALQLALRAKEAVPENQMLAVDMIKGMQGPYRIIEISRFIAVQTAEQLHVNGEPGYYHLLGDSFEFKKGRFWIQELALQELMREWIKRQEVLLK